MQCSEGNPSLFAVPPGGGVLDQTQQKFASLGFFISIVELGRPTLLALEVAWWRSRAERLPRGMDEAVGRGARSAQRAQQLPDLHWHGINSRRRGDAMQS